MARPDRVKMPFIPDMHATAMIRLGQHIRLTRPERDLFFRLTDIEPAGIRTLADLDAYVARCKAHYWGVSRETRYLHSLIDRARARCERPW
ncbi:hypothetical protein [Azohydromonas australica]|uniref:hypothetical protein n=1 Tax=Azohydromonas australica TaxID=364039 RepID=UPI00041205BF|nr:hypothetical protein [Azohydromonas australica]